jgi:hypothetical protein
MDSPYEKFQTIIRSLEKTRKSRIFSIIHCDDPQHICQPELRLTVASRDKFKNIDTLEVLLHSPGGHANVAYRLAKFFEGHAKRLHYIVPLGAKSAATLMCLNADAIFMGEFAELGPLDAQIRDDFERGGNYFSPLDEFKSMDFMKEYAVDLIDYLSLELSQRGMSVKQALHEAMTGAIGIMNPLYAHIDPTRVGSYKRFLAEGEDYAKRLLASHLKAEEAESLAQHLVWNYPSHDFVIDFNEARALRLPVKPLPASQEKALVDAIEGLQKYGLPYVGFCEPKPKRQNRAGRSAPKKVQPQRESVPTATLVKGKRAVA